MEEKKPTKKIAYFTDLGFTTCVFALALVCVLIYAIFSPTIKYEIDLSLAKRSNGKTARLSKTAQAQKVVKNIKFDTINITGDGMNFSTRKPDFIREEEKYTFTTNSNAPKWDGIKDLSMRVWVGHDTQGLVIQADILDDTFYAVSTQSSDIYQDDAIQFSFYFDNNKNYDRQWEFGFLTKANGLHLRHCWLYPAKYKQYAKPLLNSILYGVEPIQDGRRHKIIIPYNEKVGLSRETLKKGIRLNMIYNDADDSESTRKRWIEISPGIGQNKEKRYFPKIIFSK